MKKGLKVSAFNNGYNGGKEASGTWQKIINEIRPHDIFISACLGHCAITRRMKRSNKTYGIDIDPEVINAWEDMNWGWIELIKGDAIAEVSQLLATSDPKKRICIYADPTYRMESIKSKIKPYPYTMEDDWHIQFLDNVEIWAKKENVDILLSHYPDKLYDKRLLKWRKVQYETNTRKGMVIENLYMNYSHVTGELHDYRWIGENKDERYNLKHRTAKNLIAKLERMEIRKKQAVIYYMRKWLDGN